MPPESRALVALGMAALVVWTSTTATPRWVVLAGGCSVGVWLALTWSWGTAVDSVYGSCGSALWRQQQEADQDGWCDFVTAEAYNSTIPLLFLAVATALVAAGGAVAGRRSPGGPSGSRTGGRPAVRLDF